MHSQKVLSHTKPYPAVAKTRAQAKSQREKPIIINRVFFVFFVPPCENLTFYGFIKIVSIVNAFVLVAYYRISHGQSRKRRRGIAR